MQVDVRDAGSIPVLERSPEGRHGNPFQYSFLENPMDRGAWWATVHRVQSRTQLKRLSTRNMPTAPDTPTQKDSAQIKQGND